MLKFCKLCLGVESSAGKAYLSKDYLEAIEAVGAVPFLPSQLNSVAAACTFLGRGRPGPNYCMVHAIATGHSGSS